MAEASGSQWCARFPTSTSLCDLAQPFRSDAQTFIAALKDAGAAVNITATWRPAERAYLMHWAWAIWRGLPPSMGGNDAPVDPASVPAMGGVDIDWTCGGDITAARISAANMCKGYGMAYPAALASRHTQRLAVDMGITWKGVIQVKDARGVVHRVCDQQDLWPIGATYSVHKLPSDPPHWSSDGH